MRNIIPALIAVASMLWGCSPDSAVMERLAMADSLMMSRPDSALEILDAIDMGHVGSLRAQAYYGMLHTQALDKNYLDPDNDSLVSLSVDYYRHHRDDGRLMRSLFYQGRANYYAGNYTKAIVAATEADQLSRALNEDYWIAKSNELMADVFHKTFHKEETLAHSLLAVEYYDRAGFPANKKFAELDLAVGYSNNNQYSQGHRVLDSLIQEERQRGIDSVFYPLCMQLDIYCLLNDDRYRDAYDTYLTFRRDSLNYTLKSQDCSCIAEVFMNVGQRDSATAYLDLALQKARNFQDSLSAEYAALGIAEREGDYSRANLLHRRIEERRVDAVCFLMKQSAVVAQRDYFNSTAKETRLQTHILKYRLWSVSIVSVCLLMAATIYIRHRIKRKNMEIDRKVAEITELNGRLTTTRHDYSTQIDHEQNRSEELRALTETLFAGHFELLNRLCDEYFEKGESDRTRALLVKSIEEEIARMRSPGKIQELEAMVNRCRDNAVKKLRAQFPSLKEEDITFLTLIFAGLSQRTVCLLTGNKIRNFYNKRLRLKKRIADSNAPDKEVLLRLL